MNYTENVRTKSLGWAIVLTLIFGPLGLFYASVSGGLIMTLTPVALFVLFLLGAVTQSSILLASSGILLIIFALSYWIICVIWAATSVSNYNNKVINDSRHEEFLRLLDENNQANNKIVQNVIPTEITKVADNQNLDQPTIKVWKQQNPHRSLNEYYQIYGVPQSPIVASTYTYEEAYYIHEKPSNSWLYVTLVIGFVVMIAVITNPNEDKHKSAVKSKLVAFKMSKDITDKSNNTSNSDYNSARHIGVVLGSVIGSSILEEIVNDLVSTNNYLIFSTTKLAVKGENKIVGFGVFGNVFISDKLNLASFWDLKSDSKKKKTLNKIQQEVPKEVEEPMNDSEQSSTNSTSESYVANITSPISYEYENSQNSILSTENTKVEVGNFNCSPINNPKSKILSSPDPNAINTHWQDGVGGYWSFESTKKITNNNGIFLVGDLISPRGSAQPNGPYYVIFSEWSCATQLSINDIINSSEISDKYFTVVSNKAYFYNSPNLESRSKSYLVKGEMSKVYNINGDFIYTEFKKEESELGKTTKGWIRKSDINPWLVIIPM